MKRSFGIDVLRCPSCDGRMELLATIEDPAIVHRILRHLGMPTTGPPRPAPWRRPADLAADQTDLNLDPRHDAIDPPSLFE